MSPKLIRAIPLLMLVTACGTKPPAPLAGASLGSGAPELVAVRDSGFPDSLPSMRFVLEERASGRQTAARLGVGKTSRELWRLAYRDGFVTDSTVGARF